MKLEEKLGYFRKYTMEEARKSCDKMVATYSAAMAQIFEEHKETKIRMEELEYKTEKERIIRENNKRFSSEQIKLKATLNHRQTELKNKLFEEVEEHLQNFRKSPAYSELLIRELKEAVAFARGKEVILYIDPSDAEKAPELEAAVGAAVTVSSYPFVGGMRAVIPERSILIDNSFETKLAEAKEKFMFTVASRGPEKAGVENDER